MEEKTTLKQANVLVIHVINALNDAYVHGKIERETYDQILEQANQAHKQIRTLLDLVEEEPQEESRLLLYNPATQKSYRISPKEDDA